MLPCGAYARYANFTLPVSRRQLVGVNVIQHMAAVNLAFHGISYLEWLAFALAIVAMLAICLLV